jgi:hypothetical protein
MQMKRLPSVNSAMKNAIRTYVGAIAVPPYSAAAIRSRESSVAVERRQGWLAVAAIVAAAVALIAFAPAVVAGVQRFIQAFTVVDGRPTQLPVQEVTLDQLRADVAFAVVPPANVPAGFEETIDEIGAGGSSGARAMFHYSLHGGPPVLTIIENSAADRSQADAITMRYSVNRPLPPALAPSAVEQPGLHTSVLSRNGMLTRFKLTPITWVDRGTRVTLIAVPGALTRSQIDSIVRAMRI